MFKYSANGSVADARGALTSPSLYKHQLFLMTHYANADFLSLSVERELYHGILTAAVVLALRW
jgi:hypothetical protein